MEIVKLRHSRCFENGNDDFGVEAFWAIHCAHWSSGFMVLNAATHVLLSFVCPLFCFLVGARTYLHINTVQSMYNVHTKKQNKNNNTTSGRWSHRCGNGPSLFKQIPTFSFINCRPVYGATVMAMCHCRPVEHLIGDASSRGGLSRVGYFIPFNSRLLNGHPPSSS